jgi:RHS repeat-associated protein
VLNDTFNEYTWDAEGKPLSTAYEEGSGPTYTFVYDAFGHRVEWSDSGTYEYSDVTLGKFKLSARGQTPSYSEFPVPGGSILGQLGGATGVKLADWLGTARAFWSYSGGGFSQSGAHAPFGESYAYNSGSPQDFTGQENDGSMSNTTYYFPERQYRSSQGRWLSPDPAGLNAVDPTNPQTWNRYAYVLNNPLRYTDPSGLECVWDDGSYDSADDPDTGNADDCSHQGGSWVDPDLFENAMLTNGQWHSNYGDWSSSPNSNLAQNWVVSTQANGGAAPAVSTIASAVGNIYDFGPFVGTMTVGNLLRGFYETQQQLFNACITPWAPPQNASNAPSVNPTLSAQTLGLMSGGQGPAQGANNPGFPPYGMVYIAREYWDTGGVNQVNANYGTFAHETANILDATKNGQNGNYERNYGDTVHPPGGDKDTGAAVERCMFGSLQRPD